MPLNAFILSRYTFYIQGTWNLKMQRAFPISHNEPRLIRNGSSFLVFHWNSTFLLVSSEDYWVSTLIQSCWEIWLSVIITTLKSSDASMTQSIFRVLKHCLTHVLTSIKLQETFNDNLCSFMMPIYIHNPFHRSMSIRSRNPRKRWVTQQKKMKILQNTRTSIKPQFT